MGLPNTVNQLFNGGSPYYIVNRSLRFRSSASAYLNRTPSVAGSQTTWTWSGWVKRGAFGTNMAIFGAYTSSATYYDLQMQSDGTLAHYNQTASATTAYLNTTQVFRDPSAWYHIIAVYNSTDATASNRMKLYVNGVQITAFSTATYPSQNTVATVNSTSAHYISYYGGNPYYFDGYLAEINFVDGQALTPSSFGIFDSNGIWQPIRYAGTYGTNGFYLPFVDTSSTTNLVKDASGNGNNWTPNNISLTAGTTYDSMIDSPTVSASSSNYAVLNPTQPSGGTYQAGNQQFLANTSGQWKTAVGTIFAASGKYYWEVTAVALPTAGYVWAGAASSAINLASSTYNGASAIPIGGDTNGWGVGVTGGNIVKYYNGSPTTFTAGTDSVGDVWMIAVDVDAAKIWFGRNGTWLGSGDPATGANAAFTNLSGSIGPACSAYLNTGATAGLNCGQRPFSYTPPSGYNALNTANLPAATISYGAPYMNAVTYTGYGPLIPSGLGIPTKRNALNQNVSRSLRLRSSASAYLSRTIGSPSQTTNTLSVWVKRGSTIGSAYNPILGCTATNSLLNFQFPSSALNDTIQFVDNNVSIMATNAVYRNPSDWVHVVFVWDTTNATQTDRLRLYVDGVRVTSFNYANYPALNATYSLFAASGNWQIGSRQFPGALYFDGYMAQFYYIDGQALTAASFGETNSDGVWVPKSYTGTYGTNGFYLPFTDTTSTTTLVADSSGNGNNWTPNNISLTAGTTYDSMIDSPTDYASAGNYATLNPLTAPANVTVADANLSWAQTTTSANRSSMATFGMSSGKWYWEFSVGSSIGGNNSVYPGIAQTTFASTLTNYCGGTVDSWSYTQGNGYKVTNGSGSAYGATYTSNDVIGIAFDADVGSLTFYKNGVSQGVAFTGLTSGPYFPVVSESIGSSGGTTGLKRFMNFGQTAFSYSAPSGYSALNTYNITAPSKTWFSSANNSGRGSATAYPDFVWIKSRSSAQNHSLNDTLRGPTLNLLSNSTAAETGASTMFSVNKYGLTLGNDASVNSSSYTDVMWGWQAGQGTTSTNTSGSITSTVSVSAQSGFSIVTYTGTGANATVGHGLGVAPSFIIVRSRNNGGATNWAVWHTSFSSTEYIFLNSTAAKSSSGGAALWNSTLPSSTVFSIGTDTNTNYNTTNMLAYCFAAVRGYSAFGSYVGTGSSDGAFVYTGFRPRFVMWKNASFGSQWILFDTSRSTYNISNGYLEPNTSDTENTASAPSGVLDILSNGFKLRTAGIDYNDSSYTYVYAAFAENPFSIARAR